MDNKTKEAILEVINSCDTVQFCTISINGFPETRTINNKANKSINIKTKTLHFLTNVHSHKIEQIRKNQHTCLYYFNPETRKALTLFGIAKEITDKKIKDKFWLDDWKAFGYKGKDDPNYALIEFTPQIYKYYLSSTDERTGDFK